MLVSGSYDEAVFIWDVRTARVMRALPAHSDPVAGVDFIRDGTLIASCAGDGLMHVQRTTYLENLLNDNRRIWDTATGQCLRTIVHEDNAPVTCVKFSPNGKFLLAWTLDSCIRLWSYIEGRCLKTYQGHENKSYSIYGSFGVYGGGHQAFVVSGSEDNGIYLWDATSKVMLQRLEGHLDIVLGVDTLPSQSLLVSGARDGDMIIWESVSTE